jgi:hypothetical protein
MVAGRAPGIEIIDFFTLTTKKRSSRKKLMQLPVFLCED